MRHLGIKNHRDGCSEGAHGPQPLGKDLTCKVTQVRSGSSTRNTWLMDTEDTPRTLSLSCRDRRCPCKASMSWHGKFPRSCDSSTGANSGPGHQCHQQPTRGIPHARRVLSMMNKSGGFELKSGGLASDSGSLRAETAITVSHSSVAANVAFCGENRLIARNLSSPIANRHRGKHDPQIFPTIPRPTGVQLRVRCAGRDASPQVQFETERWESGKLGGFCGDVNALKLSGREGEPGSQLPSAALHFL